MALKYAIGWDNKDLRRLLEHETGCRACGNPIGRRSFPVSLQSECEMGGGVTGRDEKRASHENFDP